MDVRNCGVKMCAGLRYVPGLQGADWSAQEVENTKKRLWEMYKNPYGFVIKKTQGCYPICHGPRKFFQKLGVLYITLIGDIHMNTS